MHRCFVFLLLLTTARGALAGKAPSRDIEGWTEVDLSARLGHKATVTVPCVLRSSTELSNPQLAGIGPILDLALTSYLTLTGGYLFVAFPEIGPGYNVNAPLAAVTQRASAKHLAFADRNRVEVLSGIPHNPVRYRNKLVISLPSPSPRWQPFLSDEAFYDSSQSRWSQNRFQAGIGYQATERLRIDGFYLERSVQHAAPSASHVLGLTFEVRLRPLTRRRGLPQEEN